MKKETKSLEIEVEDLFYEFGNVVAIEDFGITTSQGTPITHITNGSTDGDFTIGLWCGDPESIDDKHAEELIVSEEERINIYKEIVNIF